MIGCGHRQQGPSTKRLNEFRGGALGFHKGPLLIGWNSAGGFNTSEWRRSLSKGLFQPGELSSTCGRAVPKDLLKYSVDQGFTAVSRALKVSNFLCVALGKPTAQFELLPQSEIAVCAYYLSERRGPPCEAGRAPSKVAHKAENHGKIDGRRLLRKLFGGERIFCT